MFQTNPLPTDDDARGADRGPAARAPSATARALYIRGGTTGPGDPHAYGIPHTALTAHPPRGADRSAARRIFERECSKNPFGGGAREMPVHVRESAPIVRVRYSCPPFKHRRTGWESIVLQSGDGATHTRLSPRSCSAQPRRAECSDNKGTFVNPSRIIGDPRSQEACASASPTASRPRW